MRSAVPVVVLLVSGALAHSPVARAADAPSADDARSAAEAGRYCEAMSLYLQVFASSNEAKYLFNAAETAFAADDKVRALELYRELLQRFPSYPKKQKVQQRVGELGRAIAKEGPGISCAASSSATARATPSTTGSAPVPATCGNGSVDVGEVCDDGNRVEGDGCDSNCTRTACGNAIRTSGELCDDGNATNGDGCDAGCLVSACGNGVVAGAEQCDDGNERDGDGCSATCTAEAGAQPGQSGGAGPAGATSASPGALPWLVGGGATALAGVVAGVVGVLPALGVAARDEELAGLEDDFASADDVDEQERIAADAADVRAARDDDAEAHNTWGRWLAPAGFALAGVGVVVAVVGVVVGGAPTEGGAE